MDLCRMDERHVHRLWRTRIPVGCHTAGVCRWQGHAIFKAVQPKTVVAVPTGVVRGAGARAGAGPVWAGLAGALARRGGGREGAAAQRLRARPPRDAGGGRHAGLAAPPLRHRPLRHPAGQREYILCHSLAKNVARSSMSGCSFLAMVTEAALRRPCIAMLFGILQDNPSSVA